MKIKFIALIILIFFYKSESKGQSKYDTLVYGTPSYSELTFQLGNQEMSKYEVNINDITIRNGVIEKNKTSLDTIALRFFKIDETNEGYEIKISDETWSKTLFGRQCKYLEDHVSYPNLTFQRNVLSKELSFTEPEKVGEFLKAHYLNRIECIESSPDKYMKKHLIRWIEMIENDSINEFTDAISSHFIHVFALFELIVPTNDTDTVICKITSTAAKNPMEFAYQTDKLTNSDSTITYQCRDKIESEKYASTQLTESLYRPLEKHLTEEERGRNEIILNSLMNEDKSYIELTKSGEFKRYLRVIESFVLDSNLEPKQSTYNFEIKKISSN